MVMAVVIPTHDIESVSSNLIVNPPMPPFVFNLVEKTSFNHIQVLPAGSVRVAVPTSVRLDPNAVEVATPWLDATVG